MTQLDGVEPSKVLLILDRSKSMSAADAEGRPTRWQQANDVLNSSAALRRMRQIAQDEKIEMVKYLGDRELQPFDKDAVPDGSRSDIGYWLHQLSLKHASDKRVRGIVLFSDGDDQSSHATLEAAIAHAEGSDATIYAIGQGRAVRTRELQTVLARFATRPKEFFLPP